MKMLIELQHLVDTQDCPFAVVDARFCILSINSAFIEEFQLEHSDVIGKKFFKMISGFVEVDKNSMQKQFQQSLQNGLCRNTCSNGNGSRRYIIKSLSIKGVTGASYTGLAFKSFASIHYK